MATEIFFPKLNPVLFVNNASGSWWTDRIPYFEQSTKYCQKFQISDVLAFQFSVLDASYVSSACTIIDVDGNTLDTLTINGLAGTYDDDYTQYHVSKSLAAIADNTQCFVKLAIGLTSGRTFTYYSEPIHVKTTWPNTLLLTYSHDENDFNIIFYDATYGDEDNKIEFNLRVEGGLKSNGFTPTSTDEIYRNDRADVTTVSSTPFLVLTFTFGNSLGIPNWLADKINRVFSCYYSQINSIYYNKAENAKFEPTRTDDYPMAGWMLDLVEDEDMNGFDNFPFDMARIYWLYRGVALTSTDPGTPTEDIFYMATLDTKASQTYTNFGGLVVAAGEQAALRYDTTDDTWYKDVFATITDTAEVQCGSIDVDLTAGVKTEVDPALATPAITKDVFQFQIFQTVGGLKIPQPGIQMYYSIADSKWYIESSETTTVTINIIAYEAPVS